MLVVLDEEFELKVKGLGKFVIVIDFGYGGCDLGVIGSMGMKEVDVVFGVVKVLKVYLDKKKCYEMVLI